MPPVHRDAFESRTRTRRDRAAPGYHQRLAAIAAVQRARASRALLDRGRDTRVRRPVLRAGLRRGARLPGRAVTGRTDVGNLHHQVLEPLLHRLSLGRRGAGCRVTPRLTRADTMLGRSCGQYTARAMDPAPVPSVPARYVATRCRAPLALIVNSDTEPSFLF